jgi:tetratricopeptide (TPR) repeat protein
LQEQIQRQQEEEVIRLEQTDRSRAMQGESEQISAQQRQDKEKIQKYLERAKQFLAEKQFEVALGEVALAFIINPFDEDVKQVEQMILRDREEHQTAKKQTAQDAVLSEQKNKNSINEKIQMHLLEAERLRSMSQFSKAFNEVAKAFILDPLDENIQKYEQDLQVEFDAFLFAQHNKRDLDEKTKIIQRHLQHAAEFLERDLFEEAMSEVKSGLAIDAKSKDLLSLQQRISMAADEWKVKHRSEARNLEIQKLLVVAKEYFTVGKFDEAIIAVRKALDYDPNRRESITLLEDIESVISQTHDSKQNELRKDRIASHMAQAQSFLMTNMLDKALVQILSGLVIDPANNELLKLEQRVTALHDARLSEIQSSSGSTATKQQHISKEEQERLIRIHVRVATEFRSQKEYAKALDEIAHGLTVDMQNEELLKLDTETRAEQTEHDQKAAQGLKLIYSSGKATG